MLEDAPFTREDLDRLPGGILSEGGTWGAQVRCVQANGEKWVVKDFREAPLPVRITFGRFLIRREVRAMAAVCHLSGCPRDPALIDPFALCYRFVAGTTLKTLKRNRENPGRKFFVRLEGLVNRMHGCGVVHLDLRNARNILVGAGSVPLVIDFQSSMKLYRFPHALQKLLKRSDLSGVYKWWAKLDPESLDRRRLLLLKGADVARRFWPFLGDGAVGIRKRRRLQGLILSDRG